MISLSDLVRTIEEFLQKKATLNILPLQSGDVKITHADISKAKHEIGYDPKYSFKEGMKEFVNWYSINKNL